MAKVSVKGLKALDHRSAGYRALMEWKSDLLRDLGGEESLTAQEKLLVELVTRQKVLLDSIDQWLFKQRSIVNGKKRVLYSVVAQRNALQNSLVNSLDRLGLKRREKRVESLAEYLAKEREKHDHSGSDGPGVSADIPEEGVAEEAGQLGGVAGSASGVVCPADDAGTVETVPAMHREDDASDDSV